MRRKFSPVRSDNKIEYEFSGELVKVTYTALTIEENKGFPVTIIETETTDIFDFSKFPNGEAVVSEIETTLSINPFISIKRINDVLELEVINYIEANATEEEKYPKWEEI
ncbi:hypothetical protein P9B03_17835 [Metasolibacillus meyeri]|uniref:DUF2283 domain-containing protein n=1 Tax=Metasolibacillus meyeri TaxID=1071052 RepID=A0AAW9NWI2_9BACL|nr:hypothetical protein [Metasolibacillus meyeri]MEC1180359.1 hypothetical protein [Metasolibacillus meyeri]